MASITCEWRKMRPLYCNCWECRQWRKRHRRKWKKLYLRMLREHYYSRTYSRWLAERPSLLHPIRYIKWRLNKPERKFEQ